MKSIFCLVAAVMVASCGFAAYPDYRELRTELRAFYPDRFQNEPVKDARQFASYKQIDKELWTYAQNHANFDALDIRQQSYLSMQRNFQPFLFKNSPFYFEAGVNGGWGGHRPARVVQSICSRFYQGQGLIPQSAFALQRARQKECLSLCCGPFADDMHHVPPFRTILKGGFKGVYDEVVAAIAKCPKDDSYGRKQLETAKLGLETIRALQLKFAAEAERMLAEGKLGSAEAERNFRRIAESAKRCPWEPPRSFYEVLNTLWFVREIVGYVDSVQNFSLGRPDLYAWEFYQKEIAAGTLTKDEARDLVAKFLVTADCHCSSDALVDSYGDNEFELPMSVGGHDKNGKFVYNELTKMFLKAHLECDCVYPKMHARIGSDAPAEYLEQIGDMLMKNHAVFTLLNDDRYIKQHLDMGFDYEDATGFIGCGCWNGFIDSVMDVDEANYLSMIKILEMSIHRDAAKEKACGLDLRPMDEAKDFTELKEIFWGNFSRFMRSTMTMYALYGRQNSKVFPHPVYSCCLRGGIESRRDTTQGGDGMISRPRVMTLGFIGNAVDSLSAINYVCFVKKAATVREFLDAVRSNWSGERGEALRNLALAAPYWGDGSNDTTELLGEFMKRARGETEGMDNGYGSKFYFAIYTYREFMYWGHCTKATPDGRRNGDRLAQGFSPSEFRCKEGVTTVMNAIGKLPHEKLLASNVNLTFDASAMNAERLAQILRVFCKKGSHMIQPNCNSAELLIEAQKHPELYRNLIVRVCGFSARFVSLSKRWQDEVIARHRLR